MKARDDYQGRVHGTKIYVVRWSPMQCSLRMIRGRFVSSFALPILAPVLAILVAVIILTPLSMAKWPRNMKLTSFDPHRKEFVCKHEVDATSPVSPQAEALFQRGLAATSFDLPPDQRSDKLAAEYWSQAASLGHWKAALNLADLYLHGTGVSRDSEKAVTMIEALMNHGVPSAFDRMGSYHQRGTGVKFDIDRAFAFWQLAAEMGSASAQARLGSKLKAAYDNPGQGFWGNRPAALKMLECGTAQGNKDAAFALGVTTDGSDESLGDNYGRALLALHESVRLGSKDGAGYLAASFDELDPLTGNTVDRARAERYLLLFRALSLNPDLRFPNLDKILPLPPAELPTWDGKRQTLIDAARGLSVRPKVEPTAD